MSHLGTRSVVMDGGRETYPKNKGPQSVCNNKEDLLAGAFLDRL